MGPGQQASAWLEMLEHIQESLRRSLEQAEPPPEQPAPVADGGPAALKTLDERLGRLQGRLAKAERDTAGADAALADAADGLRRWLEALTATRARLAG
jgi:hypothetical protein